MRQRFDSFIAHHVKKLHMKKWFVGLMLVVLCVASLYATSVNLAWTASPDSSVTGYKIYFGPVLNSQTNQLNVGQVVTATVSNLQSGVTYFFFATAYDASEVESEPSNVITYTTPITEPTNSPSPPTEVVVLSFEVVENE